MSKPVCPNCDSTSVIPDPRPGGAGRNFCQGCGHCSAVRDFHQPKTFDPANLKRGRRWVDVEPQQAPQYRKASTRKPVDRQSDVVHKGPKQEHFWWQDD